MPIKNLYSGNSLQIQLQEIKEEMIPYVHKEKEEGKY